MIRWLSFGTRDPSWCSKARMFREEHSHKGTIILEMIEMSPIFASCQ